ncbi:MAG TPA: sensor histidine kinase [Acidimicrobiia bacterium]|nr:sensor histidine kinase [Acidimicrobiia bacterium]
MSRDLPARGWLPETWAERSVDTVVAVFATAAAVVLHLEIVASRGGVGAGPALVVAATHGAAVWFRRTRPWPVLVVLVSTAVLSSVLGFPAFMLGPAILFAVYSVGAEMKDTASLVALGFVEATVAAVLVLGPGFPGLPSVVLYLVIIAVAWWLGYAVRRLRTAAQAHERRADELAATREELARFAVAEERRRIARELHDAVAHSMTVVAMHAGTGRLLANDDPSSAASSLAIIERLSRDALAEMRLLVGLLRDDADGGNGLAPTPALSDVHGLIAEMAVAGMVVDVSIEGSLEGVAAGPALAGYRIIQEALTNAAKHAGSKAILRIQVSESELVIVVENDVVPGRTAVGSRRGAGLGIIGMRERVQVYGGSLTTGPLLDGGFQVVAAIPLPGDKG